MEKMSLRKTCGYTFLESLSEPQQCLPVANATIAWSLGLRYERYQKCELAPLWASLIGQKDESYLKMSGNTYGC